jgi:uncharacterized protein YbaA (DUF1428 family)
MTYIDGFVVAVPAANKELYRQQATAALELFKEYGVTRMVENWGDDVPDGKVTDFKGAVKAKEDEVVVFSWLEYPSKAVRDKANEKMMSDPRMQNFGDMPFDGKRMIYGGFSTIIEESGTGKVGYVDGALLPVSASKKDAYLALAAEQAAVIKECGATRVVEAWGDDVPDGKITDYKGAVKASGDEKVVYCWVEWPSKQVRDDGWKKIFADPRMHPASVPYDEQRRVFGGFSPILDA